MPGLGIGGCLTARVTRRRTVGRYIANQMVLVVHLCVSRGSDCPSILEDGANDLSWRMDSSGGGGQEETVRKQREVAGPGHVIPPLPRPRPRPRLLVSCHVKASPAFSSTARPVA